MSVEGEIGPGDCLIWDNELLLVVSVFERKERHRERPYVFVRLFGKRKGVTVNDIEMVRIACDRPPLATDREDLNPDRLLELRNRVDPFLVL